MVSVIGIVLTPFQECSRPPIRIMAMLLAPGGAGTILSVTKAFVKPSRWKFCKKARLDFWAGRGIIWVERALPISGWLGSGSILP